MTDGPNPAGAAMKTLADRFRLWYAHERDANAKIVAMLESVPADRRGEPAFQKALDKAVHLVAARTRWLIRVGKLDAPLPPIFPPGDLAALTGQFAAVEALWVAYLETVDDAELARAFEYTTPDGKRLRWTVEGVLTQTNGHAWYHRGQVALLVAGLGGKFVDTDYVFYSKPTPVE